MKKIAIGGGQGFWGDSPDAAIHMIRHADIQYMACDYLAELWARGSGSNTANR